MSYQKKGKGTFRSRHFPQYEGRGTEQARRKKVPEGTEIDFLPPRYVSGFEISAEAKLYTPTKEFDIWALVQGLLRLPVGRWRREDGPDVGAVQPLPGLAVAGLEPDLIILNEG